jgi:hypothetical protein
MRERGEAASGERVVIVQGVRAEKRDIFLQTNQTSTDYRRTVEM